MFFYFALQIAVLNAASTLQTVPHVDLSRYMGTWYEIAYLDSPWENLCSYHKTVSYSPLKDGTIRVINQCQKGPNTDEYEKATGHAWVVDSETNAKLKVSFSPFSALKNFFSGDYWIILLAPDYSYAVVSEPNQNYLWILSRTPTLKKEVYESIVNQIQQKAPKINIHHLKMHPV